MELHHVLTQAAWDAARQSGSHAPPELTRDGFLHCCTAAQLGFVLRRHFAGVAGLVVIAFETEDVPAALRWVNSEPDQDPFPHLYGPIPCAAVRRAVSAASPSGPTDATGRAPASP
jgi:uncharacterized protein (DUF952 family)